MINFLLESTIGLATFIVFYYIFLEREKMHQFNRFYLLFSLAISFIIPFLNFEIIEIKTVIENIEPISVQKVTSVLHEDIMENKAIPEMESINYFPYAIWSLYLLVSLLLLLRFGKNIWKLISTSKNNPIIKYKTSKLVLVSDKLIPHSFLNYIYLNIDDYNDNSIEKELITHELVHVNQKHSLDILFVEFIKCVLWFNPLLYFYKKAIQLNHEFLADQEIVKTYNNVPYYQNLLLQKGVGNSTTYLASNLNYLVTKKRLIMMTKKTSKKIALLKKATVFPVLAGLIYFFCIEVVAQEKVILVKQNLTEIPKKAVEEKPNALKVLEDTKTIEPPVELKEKEIKNQVSNKKIIVIDAGHGGIDHGKKVNDVFESKIVESIAKKIKQLNKNNDIEIILLREDDTFIELKERVNKVNAINPHLLISLHINTSQNNNVNGVDAFVSSKNAFYEKSVDAANELIDKISNKNLAKGNVKDASIFIINNSNCPAITLEIGYLTNDNDREYIKSENGVNEIANRILEFLKQY